MKDDACRILEALLTRAEERPERSRDPLVGTKEIAREVGKAYPFRVAERTREFHAALSLVEDSGAIRLEWRRHYEGVELERIRLLDAQRLADALGRPLLTERVDALGKALPRWPAGHWLSEAVPEFLEAWRRGRKRHGLSLDDGARLGDLVCAVLVLEALPDDQVLDYRQFGARHLGDSKALAVIKGPLAQLLRARHGLEGLEVQDVLAEFNIVPLAHPVLIAGPLVFRRDAASVRIVAPYLGLAGEWLTHFETNGPVRYVLTIENLSSFLEFTATFDESAVVLYTGGYPTRRFQAFYRNFALTVPAPLYHWGDTDPHGFLILKTLQNLAGPGRQVIPHAMAHPDGRPLTKEQHRQVSRMGEINPAADALVARLLADEIGVLEQEAVPATRPVLDSHQAA